MTSASIQLEVSCAIVALAMSLRTTHFVLVSQEQQILTVDSYKMLTFAQILMSVRMACRNVCKIRIASIQLDPTCAYAIKDTLEMGMIVVKVGCDSSMEMQHQLFCLVDLNECDLVMDDCDVNALCEDDIGSFTCTCNFGYDGNGTYCSK